MECSSRIKDRKAAKWQKVLAPYLASGEVVWAFVSATRMMPMTEATVITNARVIGFWSAPLSADKVIVSQVAARDIKSFDLGGRRGNPKLTVYTANGKHEFGALHKDEVDFTRHYLDQLQATAHVGPDVSGSVGSARSVANREQPRTSLVGNALSVKQESWLEQNSKPGEVPWFVLNAGMHGQLVVYDDRLVILKMGFFARSIGAEGTFVAQFPEIRAVEYVGGFTGYLNVVSLRAATAVSDGNDAMNKPNCLVLDTLLYRKARSSIDELRARVRAARPEGESSEVPSTVDQTRPTAANDRPGIRPPQFGKPYRAPGKTSAPNKPGGDAPAASTMTLLWERSLNRHNVVRAEYAAYETDPTQFFFRPLLSDLGHPAVQAFHDAFAAADSFRLDDHVPDDRQFIQDFADRVASAESAWRKADTLARQTGVSPFTGEQQDLLRRAYKAINLALDDHAPANEREAAFSRVIELFDKADILVPVSISVSMRHQIEGAIRRPLQLTRGFQ